MGDIKQFGPILPIPFIFAATQSVKGFDLLADVQIVIWNVSFMIFSVLSLCLYGATNSCSRKATENYFEGILEYHYFDVNQFAQALPYECRQRIDYKDNCSSHKCPIA